MNQQCLQVKDRSRTEQGEEKKVVRFLADIDQFVDMARRTIDEGDANKIKRDFAKHLSRLKESKDELEQIHRLTEEEREKQNARRAILKNRAGSVEAEARDSPARSLRPKASTSQGGSR